MIHVAICLLSASQANARKRSRMNGNAKPELSNSNRYVLANFQGNMQVVLVIRYKRDLLSMLVKSASGTIEEQFRKDA